MDDPSFNLGGMLIGLMFGLAVALGLRNPVLSAPIVVLFCLMFGITTKPRR